MSGFRPVCIPAFTPTKSNQAPIKTGPVILIVADDDG